MPKVIHKCKNMTSEAFAKNYGWDMEEIPLEVGLRRSGEPLHATCPYCGEPTDKMKPAPAEEAIKLETNIRASGASRRPTQQYKAENAELRTELRALRKLIEDQAKPSKKEKDE